jgi:hypothetical protein
MLAVAGSSAGLGWEMQECKRRLKPAQLVIIVIDDEDQKNYERFSQAMNEYMNIDLKGIDVDFSRPRDAVFFNLNNRNVHRYYPIRGLISFSEAWAPSFYDLSDPSSSHGWRNRLLNALQSMMFKNTGGLVTVPLRAAPDDVGEYALGIRKMQEGYYFGMLITILVCFIFYMFGYFFGPGEIRLPDRPCRTVWCDRR